MDMKTIRRRKRPFTRQELAKALGCTARTVDNHRRRGNLASFASEADRNRVLIDADEARRFAAWLVENSSQLASAVQS